MRGRAGRKGKDEVGEAYLCCKKSDLEDVTELLEAEIPTVESCMLPEKRGISRCVVVITFSAKVPLIYKIEPCSKL
jgi:hypothetical protein